MILLTQILIILQMLIINVDNKDIQTNKHILYSLFSLSITHSLALSHYMKTHKFSLICWHLTRKISLFESFYYILNICLKKKKNIIHKNNNKIIRQGIFVLAYVY